MSGMLLEECVGCALNEWMRLKQTAYAAENGDDVDTHRHANNTDAFARAAVPWDFADRMRFFFVSVFRLLAVDGWVGARTHPSTGCGWSAVL